ncbi:hypothetical protein [Mycobacterium sp. ACS4331]|nr:hypothetical protein [Mycobacterium sp. ACS4331]
MRADEGEESIEELAKDAGKAEQTVADAVDELPGCGHVGPPHRGS